MRPMKGGNAKLSAKVRAKRITHTYVFCTPVNVAADGAAPEDIASFKQHVRGGLLQPSSKSP